MEISFVFLCNLCLLFLDGTDCSLAFVAQTLGKVCIQGHSGEFNDIFWKVKQNQTNRFLQAFAYMNSGLFAEYTVTTDPIDPPYALLSSRLGPGCHGSSTVCLHTVRYGVAEGLLEAAGERSPAMDGECAHWVGAGCQQVKWSSLIRHTI